MKTNITKNVANESTVSSVLRVAALIFIGAAFALGISAAIPNTASAADFGYGECYNCGGGYDDGWTTYDNSFDGGWTTYDNSFDGGWTTYDNSFDGGWTTYDNSFDGGWTTYDNWYTGYDYGYNYYPSYYGSYYNYRQPTYTSSGGNYNNNQNSNVNNNNVNVQVGGGGNNYTPTCSDYGLSGSYPNCHGNNNNNDDQPSCDLHVSDTSVDEGDRVTLTWDTDNADYASINQGIGRVDEDGGSERVEVDNDTTFRMTVRDNDGDEDTCSVTVRVDDDNDNDFSSIQFDGGPVNNPPTVYLSDLPYTGLEDMTPSLWASLAMLLALLGITGYFFFVKRPRNA